MMVKHIIYHTVVFKVVLMQREKHRYSHCKFIVICNYLAVPCSLVVDYLCWWCCTTIRLLHKVTLRPPEWGLRSRSSPTRKLVDNKEHTLTRFLGSFWRKRACFGQSNWDLLHSITQYVMIIIISRASAFMHVSLVLLV